MHRRQFITRSGLLAGGLLLHQQMLQAFGSRPAGVIKLGIIGCGDRGTGIMHVLKELPDFFEVTAVCDILDFRLRNAQKVDASKTFKEYKDYRQLLEDKSVDGVVIATPLDRHYPIAVYALAAGKHVYLEKTMTHTLEQAQDLVKKAAQYKKQVLQVGHQYRYTPLYFKVKDMIASGYLGKVTQIDCRWDRNWNWKRAVPEGYTDRQINWRMYKEYSGGLAAELLSHQIDFINWAFDTHPDTIIGTGGIDYYKDGREVYDNQQATLRYEKAGMIGNFGATCGNAYDGYLFKLKGTRGTVRLLVHEGAFYPESELRKELQTVDGVTGASKIEWRTDGGIPILSEPQKDGTWYALRDFHKSITEKQQPASNVITGATTAVCVHLANAACYGKKMMEWQPAYNF